MKLAHLYTIGYPAALSLHVISRMCSSYKVFVLFTQFSTEACGIQRTLKTEQ